MASKRRDFSFNIHFILSVLFCLWIKVLVLVQFVPSLMYTQKFNLSVKLFNVTSITS